MLQLRSRLALVLLELLVLAYAAASLSAQSVPADFDGVVVLSRDDLASIGSGTKAVKLVSRDAEVQAAAAKAVARCPALETIDFSGASLESDDWRTVLALKTLMRVTLSQSNVVDSVFPADGMPVLKELDVSGCLELTADLALPLKKCPLLSRLRVANVQFGLGGLFAALAATQSISALDISGTRTTVAELNQLGRPSSLVRLVARQCPQLTGLPESWSGLVRLQHVDLSKSPRVTTGVVELLGGSDALDTLLLDGNEAMSDDDLAKIVCGKSLVRLSLRGCKHAAGKTFAALKSAVALNELDLSDCAHLVSKDLTHIENLMLTALCLDGCAALDDSCVKPLSAIRTLEQLSLLKCPRVSDEAIKLLWDALPQCEVLPVWGMKKR